MDGVCRALGTRQELSQPPPCSGPCAPAMTGSTFAPAAGPVLGGLHHDDVPVLLQTPEPEARGRLAPLPPRAVLPTDRLAGEPGREGPDLAAGEKRLPAPCQAGGHAARGTPNTAPTLRLPQTNRWRLSDVNQEFTTCPTYPPAVIVPAAVADDALRTAARFRQGGRFPVLSYYHPKNGTVSPPPCPAPRPLSRHCQPWGDGGSKRPPPSRGVPPGAPHRSPHRRCSAAASR